jgi:hypothetical protein
MKRYLLKIENNTTPYVSYSFKNDKKRIEMAKEHRIIDREKRDGLFRVDVFKNGKIRVESFKAIKLK